MNLIEFIRTYHTRRDPWSSDYEGAMQISPEAPQSPTAVDPLFEAGSLAGWKGIPSLVKLTHALDWQTLLFVDGVRRMHLRLHMRNPDGSDCYGGIGTVAAGALALVPGQPLDLQQGLRAYAVRRFCIACGLTPPFESFEEEIEIPGVPGPICGACTADNTPEAAIIKLQRLMRHEEDQLVNQLELAQDELLIMDGPLPGHSFRTPGLVVGFVKTMHTRYLEDPFHQLLYSLQPRERTPLFKIGSEHLSCYIRLAACEALDTPLAGLVRLEMRHHDSASAVANTLTGLLPELASCRMKDPRAPQNLFPIQALENRLRHLMGPEPLLRRQLEAYLFHNLERTAL